MKTYVKPEIEEIEFVVETIAEGGDNTGVSPGEDYTDPI